MSDEIFLLPDVGEGLVEAEIVAWKVKEGDVVTLNQPLVDIETAKATVELPSPYAGVVLKLHGNVGDVMEVHKPLITFDVGGDASAPASAAPASAAPSTPSAPESRGTHGCRSRGSPRGIRRGERGRARDPHASTQGFATSVATGAHCPDHEAGAGTA